ncbi:DUF1648 domain-containing protein [Clostridium sp. D2Q-11]|uniref:DUF1648 domain-containing protein n=1 Tax=Anaeromonas frigoriresistens TaxID=2683708 RepID=A0A942UTW6_9FIRM|nr:DUF1648 domain-containing protein [Anaeromonas frigoriresistens]MBS4539058.1 DUF1648 domain-containing protein [Anaeromonas frigoriresistens]
MLRCFLYKLFKINHGDSDESQVRTYHKINLTIVIICFIWNAIMYFFFPKEIPMQWDLSGNPTWTLPSILGIWVIPSILLYTAFSMKVREKLDVGSTAVMIFRGVMDIGIYGYLALSNII